MKISCFPASEGQLYQIIQLLREAGLSSRYEEQAHGESILISVSTRSVDEREKVKAIFREVGITELLYSDENVA
jgi:DNA-binding PadR family transcriptional regulator